MYPPATVHTQPTSLISPNYLTLPCPKFGHLGLAPSAVENPHPGPVPYSRPLLFLNPLLVPTITTTTTICFIISAVIHPRVIPRPDPRRQLANSTLILLASRFVISCPSLIHSVTMTTFNLCHTYPHRPCYLSACPLIFALAFQPLSVNPSLLSAS